MAAKEHNGRTAQAGTAEIDAEDLAAIRHSLLMGLACIGELERLDNETQLTAWCNRRRSEYPDGFRPINQSGDAAEFCHFANALRLVDSLTNACEARGVR